MSKIYRSSFLSNPNLYFALLFVTGVVGFYFGISEMRAVFLANLIPLVGLFINNLYPQVLKLVYDQTDDTLTLSISKYLFIRKTVTISKDQLRINFHDYPKSFAQPLEVTLITADGTVYVMNTKFWGRKQLKKVLKEVWQIDVASPKQSANK